MTEILRGCDAPRIHLRAVLSLLIVPVLSALEAIDGDEGEDDFPDRFIGGRYPGRITDLLIAFAIKLLDRGFVRLPMDLDLGGRGAGG